MRSNRSVHHPKYISRTEESRGERRISAADRRKWERIRYEGTTARQHGAKRAGNPYERGGDEWSAWDLGWMEAV